MIGKGSVDLIIALRDPSNPTAALEQLTDKITIQNFVNTGNRIEGLAFADSTTLNISNIFDTIGTDSDDTIVGWAGIDTMFGGQGDDHYLVNDGGDMVLEQPNAGMDSITSSISYALAENIENLTLTGDETINATGNSLDNLLTGNSADNSLFGGAGNDLLAGEGGADLMIGGPGDDTYWVDNVNDLVSESPDEGTDTIYSSVSFTMPAMNTENLTLIGSEAINATGNTRDNTLIGNSGNNHLLGGYGSDTYLLDIGCGTDTIYDGKYARGDYHNTYVVDYYSGGTADRLQIGAGITAVDLLVYQNATDLIIGIRNPNTPNATIEQLTDKIIIQDFLNYGNRIESFEFADGTILDIPALTNLTATAGDDTINLWYDAGGTVTAGDGNDTITTGNGNDVVFAGEGDDHVNSGAGNDTIYGEAGNDTISSGRAHGNKTIFGGEGDDTIYGNLDSDLICGDTGNDTIISSTGNDLITGGTGVDHLEGGADNDTYLFDLGDGIDTIYDGAYAKGSVYNTTYAYWGGSDTIKFGPGITENDVAIFRNGNDLQIGYGLTDLVTVENSLTSGNKIERTELSDGSYLTDTDINLILQGMDAIAANNGITLNSITEAMNYQEVMDLIATSWH